MIMGDSSVAGNHITTTIPEDRSENVDQTRSKETNSSAINSKETMCNLSEPSLGRDSSKAKNNNIDLPNVEKDTRVAVEPPVSVHKESQSLSSSPQKTHTRAMSDSAVGVGKMFGSGASFQPGHQRHNSWKEVDPRTGNF